MHVNGCQFQVNICMLLLSVCYDYIKIFENMSMCDEAELGEPGWKAYSNGSCYLNGIIKGIWDLKIASDHNIYRTLPSQEYYEYVD